MDEAVLRGMARWPDVPSVYGWLSLDRRGDWRIKGERVAHRGLAEFISRNYECDEMGRWYFQNGPQRVYVKIERLPFVVRLMGGPSHLFITHTGRPITHLTGLWLHCNGEVILGFDGSAGLLCDRDLDRFVALLLDSSGAPALDTQIEAAIDAARRGTYTGLTLRLATGAHAVEGLAPIDLGARFGFVADPRPAPGQPEC